MGTFDQAEDAVEIDLDGFLPGEGTRSPAGGGGDYSGVSGSSRLQMRIHFQNIGDFAKKLVFRSFDQLSVSGSL